MSTTFLQRPDGCIAYDVRGPLGGPLVVCSPGMGDLRSTFDALADHLAAAGARVVTADLRGHGESSTGWPAYDEEAVADDLLALVEHHGGRAVIVGNSFSAGAAVVAAARRPQDVLALALTGPFVREVPASRLQRLGVRLMSTGPGRRLWPPFWSSLVKARPADFTDRRAALVSALAQPGRWDAVRAMVRAGHARADRAVRQVVAPTLVVMGTADPDFPDPLEEARWIADSVAGRADVLLVPGAGHYPHWEAPDVVAPRIADLVRDVSCPAQD